MKCSWLVALCLALPVSSPATPEALTVDGKLEDAFWRAVPARSLSPAEPGVPAAGGNVWAGVRGGYLCLAASLPEAGGKVLARSAGRNPVWEKDYPESPAVEDRVEFELLYRTSEGERRLSLAINPWGAWRAEQDGQVADVNALVAAEIRADRWTAEAAVPLPASDVRVRAVRLRSRRALAPEFRWSWPDGGAYGAIQASDPGAPAPEFRAPVLGNTEPPLEVGSVSRVPPLSPYLDPTSPAWDDAAWRDVPAFELPRNEPFPRQPRYRTEVKWMHDRESLALLFRVSEPEPLAASNGGRDAALVSDDHVAIYLATDGAAYVEVLLNSVGAIRDGIGSGLRSQGGSSTNWNAPIETRTNIRNGAWIARINLPLRNCAAALGEKGVPSQWRVLIARYRAPRPGEPEESSALPPLGSRTFSGPLRYRRMVLSGRTPQEVARPGIPWTETPQNGLAGELARLDPDVWPALERRYRGVRTMVRAQQQRRAESAVLAERRDWDEIATREQWERFRDERLERLRQSIGEWPPARPPLDVRVGARREGKGYRLENIAYQSRPGFYVPANLYLPAAPKPPMPAIVILHSFHYPKTQGEMQDMGQLWARVGCAVLIVERLGFGERTETTPWYRQANASEGIFRQQLNLVAETHEGWMAWDLIRAVDLLSDRQDIDPKRIVLIGSVAGGGEPAAIAAALDPRIAAVVPYNYDHGRVRLDADFPGELTKQINMSLITASLAPRRYVHAFEFGWEGAAQPDFPDLWVSAWDRSRKIWGLYNAMDNLASCQAYGLIRLSMERVSHAWSVGPQHRVELYPVLQRWFGIPLPLPEDVAILPDSKLGVNPFKAEARIQEAQRRRPDADLVSVSPSLAAQLPRRQLHQLAHDMGVTRLEAGRAKRAALTAEQARLQLRQELARKLGEIEPARAASVETYGTRPIAGGLAEAIAITVEEGIRVPVLLIRPPTGGPAPVVVALASGGKARMLASRASEIATLLEAGVAVCIPDLRGTGETAPERDWQNTGAHLLEMEVALGNTLLGARLKDLRSVLQYLRSRPDLDRGRMAVWGEGFAPPNANLLFADAVDFDGVPPLQYHADPEPATLTLLAALYEDDVTAVAARGGLAGYLTVLEDAFSYVPASETVFGILQAGDIPDVVAAAAPRPVLLEAPVNGRNQALPADDLTRMFRLAGRAYERAGAAGSLSIRAAYGDVAGWLVTRLNRK